MPLQGEFNDAADEWFGLDPAAYPAVPCPANKELIAVRSMVPLPVSDTPGFRAREGIVEAALLILSQSETGRKFLTTAMNAGYSIVVDPPVIGGAGLAHEDEAFGSTDHANKRINVRGVDDPQRLALTLAHETAHISQIINGSLDLDVRHSHPVAALRQLLAMEGDARAHEMQVAIELSYAKKDDPEERLLFPDMVKIATEEIGSTMLGKLMGVVTPRLPDGIAQDKVMAAVFKSFYGSASLRLLYEDTILEALRRYGAEDLQNPAQFTGGPDAAALMKKIDAHGVAYLEKNATGYIDLDGPQMLSVCPATQATLATLEKTRRENPATQDDPSWLPPVYGIALPAPPRPKPASPAP